jgi:hypothetical protein
MLGKLLVAASLLAAVPAYADHPRREEVNARLANQNHRINAGVRDGSLTPREAHKLRREDRAIRAEERAFAATHNGHITRGEQRLLNRQEDRVSRQIYRERRD